jgi:hypothetical protein
MSSSIEEQYRVIRSAIDDEALWQKLEVGWMKATGHVFEEGDWQRKSASAGTECWGFAFDPVTGRAEQSQGHADAYHRLVESLCEDEDCGPDADCVAGIERRVMKGWAMKIAEFEATVVHLENTAFAEAAIQKLEKIEEAVLAAGFLSLTSTSARRNLRESERFRARTRKPSPSSSS